MPVCETRWAIRFSWCWRPRSWSDSSTEFDAIHDHLYRAALWKQNDAVGYPPCACAPYVNGYPPNGEIGVLFTMVLGAGDRFVGLVQTLAYVVIPIAALFATRTSSRRASRR